MSARVHVSLDAMADQTNRPTRRTLKLRDWISTEPGAWVIVLMPALTAFFAGGPSWDSAWLVVLWCLCYCVQFCAARFAKSRGRARYRAPMLTYAALLAILGVPFLLKFPEILWWVPLFAILFAGSLICSYRRAEHSIIANLCAVLASSAMAIPVTCLGSRLGRPFQEMLPSRGVEIACAYVLVLFASVLYVKTMIRERGNSRYLAASWVWHVLITAVGFCFSPIYGILGVILLARAIIVPLATRKLKQTVKVAGISECVSSLISFSLITYAAMTLPM